MSRGHYIRAYDVQFTALSDVSGRAPEQRDVPELCALFAELEDVLAEIIGAMDNHYSGDSCIEDMRVFELQALSKLRALFPEDSVDPYDGLAAIEKRARRMDEFEKTKKDVRDAFDRMPSIRDADFLKPAAKISWLYDLLQAGQQGTCMRGGSFVAPRAYGVQLLADWQLQAIREQIARLEADR